LFGTRLSKKTCSQVLLNSRLYAPKFKNQGFIPIPFPGIINKIRMLVVHSGKMLKNFARTVKNFHNLNLRRQFEDWAGQAEGNLIGQKSEVSRECQMFMASPYYFEYLP